MIKNNKIARKKQEARGKNLWNSECHHACMIGRVVTKVNEVKQEISGFEGSEGIKKGAIIRRCGPILFLGLIILSQFVDVLAKT